MNINIPRRAVVIGCAVAVVLVIVGVFVSLRHDDSSNVDRQQLTVDLLRRTNGHEPNQDQIDAAIRLKDGECGEDETSLGFFVALSKADVQFAIDLLHIWCPETGDRLASVASSAG